ncbi:MAG TPA: PilZ domain-containing protein [Bryobacteraceae bacterium]|nr:PilZ domain-containing protein [Bryobacteraceae bacterium]
MDRRREPRFPSHQPARVTFLATPERTVDGTLIDVSAWGVQLLLAAATKVNVPVRIDAGDTMMLGDVCYCRAANGEYYVGVKLAHSLIETPALTQLVQRLRAIKEALIPSSPSKG